MRNSAIKEPIKLSSHLHIGPQPDAEDLEKLAEQGIKTVINLSKKGEYKQKLKPEEESVLAKDLGLAYHHQPVAVRDLNPENAQAILGLISEADKPVYLHCCFGQRSGTLGFIYHAVRRKLNFDKTIEKAKKLGMDLTAPFLSDLIKKSV